MSTRYDTIILGAGQAGPGLANTLNGRGERVALVEAERFGGTCLNSGCRPTKALRASARAAHMARASAELGVHASDVTVDFPAVIARKNRLIDRWRDQFGGYFESSTEIDYLHGFGSFTAPSDDGEELHHVRVSLVDGGETTLAAPRVVINTGSRSVPPSIAGLADVPWLDHRSILDLAVLPEHLVVLGGSYIGLELGQIFRRFGSEVTVVEHRDRVVSREDPSVSDAIAAFFDREGIDIRTSATIESVHSDGALHVTLTDGMVIDGCELLIAAGRVPNSDRLELDAVGVATDARGYITTDDTFATNIPGIYAVGDVNGRGAFTHTAYQDYEILADHLAGGPRTVAGRTMTYALFTDPPLGRVGMNVTQAEASGRRFTVSTYPMNQITRAVLDGETDGEMTLIVDDETGRFLGASILGLHADELAQTISALMHAEVPASTFATWLPIHPTMAEFFPTVLSTHAPAH